LQTFIDVISIDYSIEFLDRSQQQCIVAVLFFFFCSFGRRRSFLSGTVSGHSSLSFRTMVSTGPIVPVALE
jgi:hypothetical protein